MDSNTVQAWICQALLSQQLTFKIAKFEVRLELLKKIFLFEPPLRDKKVTPEPYLPSANRVSRLCKRPLENAAHLEGICSYLYHIVKQRPEGSHGISRREKKRVTKLKEQLKIIVKCTLCQKINTLVSKQILVSDIIIIIIIIWQQCRWWLVSLTPDWVVQNQALAGDIVLCSWARHLTPTVLLSTQVYKWVPANLMLGVTLRWTSIPSRME